MARVHRVREKARTPSPPPGGNGSSRVRRLDAIIGRAEKLMTSVSSEGNFKAANSLRKKARAAARLASRLIGIMVIEFNEDVAPQIERTRMVFLRDQEAQSRLKSNGAKK